MEPRHSNLHMLLRHRLSLFQPYTRGRWSPSLEFFTLQKNQSKKGSTVWDRVTAAWKHLKNEVTYIKPSNLKELLSCSIWFCPTLPIIGPGFSKQMATMLHKKGMRHYRDIWRQNRFMNPMETQEDFGLLPQESGAWEVMT